MSMKRISADTMFNTIHLNVNEVGGGESAVTKNSNDIYHPGQYVACTYDSEWHIGNIVGRSDLNSDV